MASSLAQYCSSIWLWFKGFLPVCMDVGVTYHPGSYLWRLGKFRINLGQVVIIDLCIKHFWLFTFWTHSKIALLGPLAVGWHHVTNSGQWDRMKVTRVTSALNHLFICVRPYSVHFSSGIATSTTWDGDFSMSLSSLVTAIKRALLMTRNIHHDQGIDLFWGPLTEIFGVVCYAA